MRPLADEIRPQTLDEVAGQKHLLGEGALLRRLIENGAEANLIFYGPSGTGKTTIANIIAKRTQKALYHLNATTASLQDIKAIIADVDTMLALYQEISRKYYKPRKKKKPFAEKLADFLGGPKEENTTPKKK